MPAAPPLFEETEEIPSFEDTTEIVEERPPRGTTPADFVEPPPRPEVAAPAEDFTSTERVFTNIPQQPPITSAAEFDARFARDMARGKLQEEGAGLRAEGDIVANAERAIDLTQEGIISPGVAEKALMIGAPALNFVPGVRRSVAEAASGLTSPLNAGLMVATGAGSAIPKIGGAVARGVAGGFAADIAGHMPELGTAAGTAAGVGTPEEKQKALADIGVSAVMGGLAGGGAFHRTAPIPPDAPPIIPRAPVRPEIPPGVVEAIAQADAIGLTKSAQAAADVVKQSAAQRAAAAVRELKTAETPIASKDPSALQSERGKSNPNQNELQTRTSTVQGNPPETAGGVSAPYGRPELEASITWLDAIERNDQKAVANAEAQLRGTDVGSQKLAELKVQIGLNPEGPTLRTSNGYGESIRQAAAQERARSSQELGQFGQQTGQPSTGVTGRAQQNTPQTTEQELNAIQESPAAKSLLRQERSQMGLQQMEQGKLQEPSITPAVPREPARPQGGPEAPILLADRVAAMAPDEFVAAARSGEIPGGLSKGGYAAGEALKTPEGIRHLRELSAKAKAETEAAFAAEDAESAMKLSLKGQFFTEALEAATGALEFKKSDPAKYRQLIEAQPLPEPSGAKPAGEEPTAPVAQAVPSGAPIKPRAADKAKADASAEAAKNQPELPGTYAAKSKAIADKLREQFKTETGGQLFTGPVEIINAAVEIAARIIEYGGSAADAMAAALKHIRANWKGEFDEAAFRTKFDEAIKVPDTAGENVKMRKSAERATESPMIPEPVQERIAEAPESRYTQQSMARVEDAVKAMTDSELGAVPADSNLFVASRLEQADRRFRAGDNDGGYQIFVDLEKQGTSFGQNINQFKRLAGTRPEYVATIIDKKLTKAGKDPLTDTQRATAIETARKSKEADVALDKATDAWRKEPTDANAAQAETALDTANAAALDLQKFVAKFEPRGTASVLKSVLQGNLLTPISEVANLFGNMSFLPFRMGERGVATFLDIVDSAIRGKPRELSVQPLAGTAEALKGVGRGLKKIPDILIEGTGNVIKGETRAGLHPIKAWINQFAKNPEMPTTGGKLTLRDRLNLAIEGTFGVPAEAMLRGLGAGDVPFKEAARARVTAEQLKLNNVPRAQWSFAQKFPELFLPREALQQIQKDTMASVFQRESKTLNLLTNWLRGKGEVVDLIAATVAPYKLTPWNIVGEILSYNPLIAMSKSALDARSGNSRGAKLNAGKMVVGSMLTGTGIWLYKNGLLAPSLDERDEAQKARVLSQKVLPPNHINISGLKRKLEGGDPEFKAGDETVDVFRAGGLAGAMFYMTANIGRDMERGPAVTDADLWTSIIRQSTLEQARFGLNQSFLSSVDGLLTAIKEGNADNYLRQWANTVGSIPLPNTLNTLSRASRKYQVDVKADEFKDKIANLVKTKLGFAGLDDYLPLKRDFWGKPMLETPEGRDAIFYHFFDISKNKQVTSDPVELELYRIWRKTGDSAVIPSLPQRMVTFAKSSYALEPKQYERYAELVGENRRNIVDALVINPQFHKLSDEQKMNILERAYRDGMERGKALFYREFQGTLTPKAGRAGFQPQP